MSRPISIPALLRDATLASKLELFLEKENLQLQPCDLYCTHSFCVTAREKMKPKQEEVTTIETKPASKHTKRKQAAPSEVLSAETVCLADIPNEPASSQPVEKKKAKAMDWRAEIRKKVDEQFAQDKTLSKKMEEDSERIQLFKEQTDFINSKNFAQLQTPEFIVPNILRAAFYNVPSSNISLESSGCQGQFIKYNDDMKMYQAHKIAIYAYEKASDTDYIDFGCHTKEYHVFQSGAEEDYIKKEKQFQNRPKFEIKLLEKTIPEGTEYGQDALTWENAKRTKKTVNSFASVVKTVGALTKQFRSEGYYFVFRTQCELTKISAKHLQQLGENSNLLDPELVKLIGKPAVFGYLPLVLNKRV